MAKVSKSSRADRHTGHSLLLTLPEQIADAIGAAIAQSILAPGHRLTEVDLAREYGVSRAPVREAIRLLARRGLVDFAPRRGAFVVELTIEKVIDVFNVMAVVVGLAARYFAVRATEEDIEKLDAIVSRLEELADDPHCDPGAFGTAGWRMTLFLGRHCGSQSIASLLDHQFNHTAWGTLWRQTALDFTTPARRAEVAAITRCRFKAIVSRDGDRADELSREMTYVSRDHAVAALSRLRGEPNDHERLLVVSRELMGQAPPAPATAEGK